MIRKAFVMKVNVGEAEYAKRHNPIWPELETLFAEKGVHNAEGTPWARKLREVVHLD